MSQVAERLAAIAARYGFEGWLVNIENPMRPDHLVRLRHFLRYDFGSHQICAVQCLLLFVNPYVPLIILERQHLIMHSTPGR